MTLIVLISRGQKRWSAVTCVHRPNRQLLSTVAASFTARSSAYEKAKELYAEQFNQRKSSFGNLELVSDQLAAPINVDVSWRPVEALKHIADATNDNDPIVAVKIDGQVHGLSDNLYAALQHHESAPTKPLRLEFVRFGSQDGKRVFWHSAAHVLGASLEAKFGESVLLTDGPAVLDAEGGFFYEMHFKDPSVRIGADMYIPLEEGAKRIASAKHPFERITVDKDTARHMFADNPFKLDMLERIPPGELITVYRCGPFVDLCRGPHLPHTGYLKHMKLHKSSGAHWQATGKDASIQGALLQRVYGVAFPAASGLRSWVSQMEQAKARDHRVIGSAQRLFMFHDLSPGSTFLMPHGTRIYNKLLALLRAQYRARGYDEVITPQLFKRGLWRTSGHGSAYAENMYAVTPGLPQQGWPQQPQVEGEHSCGHSHHGDGAGHVHAHGAPVPADVKHSSPHHPQAQAQPASQAQVQQHALDPTDDDVFGLKPMNCPGHCLLYAARGVSYRDLPIRLADFSSLHRNEASGALTGLTRVRKFSQDDAHIFCTEQQIQQEVAGCLDFVAAIYGLFGFSFRLKLSTRPDAYVGDVDTWTAAETALGNALKAFLAKQHQSQAEHAASTVQFEVDEGGGAFYGPKIDVFVRDAIGREHQCATVQLDFNLPKRFGLTYRNDEGADLAPVMIHRAILGSVERFMAVLIEHTAGKWPFWLSPRQVLLCPVADRHVPYARRVAQQLQFPLAAVDGTTVHSSGDADRQTIAAHLLGSAGSATHAGDAGTPVAMAVGVHAQAVGKPSEGAQAMHRDSDLWVEVDDSTRTVGKKVREGQLECWNLQVVLGDAEEQAGSASVRFRDQATHAAFLTAWADVSPAAAAHAREAAASQASADAAKAAAAPAADIVKSTGGGKKQGGALAAAAAPTHTYNSPLVTMAVPVLRQVCERMLQRYL